MPALWLALIWGESDNKTIKYKYIICPVVTCVMEKIKQTEGNRESWRQSRNRFAILWQRSLSLWVPWTGSWSKWKKTTLWIFKITMSQLEVVENSKVLILITINTKKPVRGYQNNWEKDIDALDNSNHNLALACTNEVVVNSPSLC